MAIREAITDLDTKMMRRALAIAKRGAGYVSPNPLVGCVIVNDTGEIIGEGAHLKFGEAHAEPNAILDAESKGHSVRGSTVYVTLEPHSHEGKTRPCSTLLIEKGIARCVAAMEDPYPLVQGRGFQQLREAGIAVDVGLLREEAEELNRFFIKHVRTALPYVALKLAMTMDGRSALSTGESRWITSETSRRRVHELRATYDGVLIGARTAIVDDPELTVRLTSGRQPWRIVLDAKKELPSNLKLLQDEYRDHTIVITEPVIDDRIDLEAALRDLARRKISSVLVEAGPTLAASLIENELIDEILLFQSPMFLGSEARPAISELRIGSLSDAMRWKVFDLGRLDEDVLITLRR